MTGISRIANIVVVTFVLRIFATTGAMAQAGPCDSGSMRYATTCFDKLLDQANSDMAVKYASAQAMLKHPDGETGPLNAQLVHMIGGADPSYFQYLLDVARKTGLEQELKTGWARQSLSVLG